MYNRKGAIVVDCYICHEPFSVKPYKAISGKPLCCSRTCEGIRRKREKREVRTCKECNTTFEVHKSELRKSDGHGTYCSTKCRGARTKEVHTGKIVSQDTRAKQSAAKKGIIPWNKLPPESGKSKYYNYGSNWIKVAASIRERDKYTCQNCGLLQITPLLVVHHIKPRRIFNGDFELADDPSNLMTLCRPCHVLLEPSG